MTLKFQAELDSEGMDLLTKLVYASRLFTSQSPSHPNSEELSYKLFEAVFAFNEWEAGAMLVPVR